MTTTPQLPNVRQGGRVGILGGSFDPPHLGHQLLALCALALGDLDALWVVPCGNHPFQKNLSLFEQRLQMCHMAFSHFSEVSVVPIEETLPKPSYTAHTLAKLHEIRPDLNYVLVMGSDVYADLDRWMSPQLLVSLCELLVFLRQGSELALPNLSIPRQNVVTDFVLPHVKSTRIRLAVQAGQMPHHFVDKAVLEYIQAEQLYR